jgi:hypothetical protein
MPPLSPFTGLDRRRWIQPQPPALSEAVWLHPSTGLFQEVSPSFVRAKRRRNTDRVRSGRNRFRTRV